MGRYRIPADAWRQATLVLLRYPETKKAMDILEGESRTRIGGVRSGAKPSHPDPTATAALRLYEDAKYQRLKREAKAVECAVADLDPVELEVTIRDTCYIRKNREYTKNLIVFER